MPEFVLQRTFNLVGKGHNIRFEKGKPTYVPPELVAEAVGIGALSADGENPDILPPEARPEEHLTPEEREALLFAAFDDLVAKNQTTDFGGDGIPSVDAVKRTISFSVVKKEVVAAWRKYKAAKAAEE